VIVNGRKEVPSPLISAAELRTSIVTGNPPVLLDVRWRLGADDPRGEYTAGHLPGAIYVDLESELAGAPDPAAGRHPLPSPAALGVALSRWGIGPDTDVVVYDDNAGMSAARAWWLLRWLGHERVRLLDGGLAAWRAAGGPLTTEVPAPTPSTELAPPVGGAVPTVAAADIAAGRVGTLLDARAVERFRGDEEPIDAVAGHIPGAVSAPTAGNLAPDGTFLSPAELRRRFERLGATPDRGVAVYCGSGVTAAHEVLALELAGIPAALYPASWSGWIADPGHPVATGE
jgi:thiosulfate/3-mercaptopyruvate sulfurtransferase